MYSFDQAVGIVASLLPGTGSSLPPFPQIIIIKNKIKYKWIDI